MRKRIFIFLLLALLVLGVTQMAYATDVVVNKTPGRSCFLDYLPEDAREQAETIIRDFHANMTDLRERMAQTWDSGDREAKDEIRQEMRELREEKRDAILNLLPEEYKEAYQERGFQGQQKFRPEGHGNRGGGHGHGMRMQERLETNNI